jgi:integrase/recombinase XerD
MFDQLFIPTAVAKRHFDAPLCCERLAYLQHLERRGAARRTLAKTAPYLLAIVSSLGWTSPVGITPQQIAAAAERWITRQPGSRCKKDGRAARTAFVSTARDWFRFLGVLRIERIEPPYSAQLETFIRHMRQERAFSQATIQMLRCRAAELLQFAAAQNVSLDRLSIDVIDKLTAIKASRGGLTRVSMQTYTYNLRSFLRYGETQGWCQPGLAAAIRPARVYKGAIPPAGPSWDDVRKLVAGTQGDEPGQIRDRAIILLFVLYGLRTSEVRRLCLTDLDWQNKLVRVRRSKQTQHVQTYPLTATVADALVRYLRRVRGRSEHQEVFLHLRAPYQPLSNSAFWQIVSHRLLPLKLDLRHHGPHSLRHACATRLLECGMRMKDIGDFLGHQNPASTAIYAAVNLAGLRQVAELDMGRFI